MKAECSIVKDLLPLFAEDMVSEDTAAYIHAHLQECPACRAELSNLKEEGGIAMVEQKPTPAPDSAKPFKRIMKRVNRQFDTLAYLLIVFFVFLGFSWTAGENLMYNSLIMPIVGVFGYCVFGWRAVYKMPILLLGIDLLLCLFKLVAIDLYSALMWTLIYSTFVFVGIAIAFLLHYAFRKEKKE